ncbi:MAG: peptidoglycan DD-metalloendopeptidase family protein [Dokdonella sp.]
MIGSLAKRTLRQVVMALLVLALSVALAQEPAPAQRKARETAALQQLETLRKQIKELTARSEEQRGERDALTRDVREQDLAIATIAKDLRGLDDAIAAKEVELASLDTRRDALVASLRSQREALASLLRSAYALGRHEELKLLLQQDDVAAIARVLAYHRYFQQAQVRQIDALQKELAELASVQQSIVNAKASLAASREARAGESAKLDQQRAERARLLATVETDLAQAGSRIDALAKNEKGLVDLLEQLKDVFADIPTQLVGAESFASLRGRLAKPVSGKLLAKFGSEANGQRSSGVRLAATAGSDVRAVAYGRVVFADWFKGYGLMIIIDHGDNYLSLYGYNETLRREVGDWVQAGEIVASSGASGGQHGDSVYFELRQKGSAIDPATWFKR